MDSGVVRGLNTYLDNLDLERVQACEKLSSELGICLPRVAVTYEMDNTRTQRAPANNQRLDDVH